MSWYRALLVNNVYNFISHLKGNTLRFRYKDEPINAV
jgi:hypothetical protein